MRIEQLKTELAPLKEKRLGMQAEINRLTFESVIAADGDAAEAARTLLDADQERLNAVNAQIAPLQAQLEQLPRQFWVSKERVRANKYDLSASRYRQVEQDETYYESPQVTMKRLLTLEEIMASESRQIMRLLA